MATTARKLTKCLCSSFEFGQHGPDGDAESFESTTTGCIESTHRTFAMGHDAKLAGYLVRAELDGLEISRSDGGMRVTFAGAIAAAQTISDKFAEKVAAQLAAGVARLVRKQAAANRKASKPSAERKLAEAAGVVVPLGPIEAMIKVGRWTYPAQIDRTTREATYQGKLGGAKTVAQGKYTVL